MKGDETKEPVNLENNFQNLVRQTFQGLRKIVPDYFQNAWAQPQRLESVFVAGTQTQTQTQVETETDKNAPRSASQELAMQLTFTRPASTFASAAQEDEAQAPGARSARGTKSFATAGSR
mgnify:CR=1 FL=1